MIYTSSKSQRLINGKQFHILSSAIILGFILWWVSDKKPSSVTQWCFHCSMQYQSLVRRNTEWLEELQCDVIVTALVCNTLIPWTTSIWISSDLRQFLWRRCHCRFFGLCSSLSMSLVFWRRPRFDYMLMTCFQFPLDIQHQKSATRREINSRFENMSPNISQN